MTTIAALALTAADSREGDAPLLVRSPNGEVEVRFSLKNDAGGYDCPFYSVSFRSKPIVLESRLAIEFEAAPPLASGFVVKRVSRDEKRETYAPLYGERQTIRNHYNEMMVELQESGVPGRILQLVFRAFDEGAALRYSIPEQPNLREFTISAEKTQFRFPDGCFGYEEHGTEGEYKKVPVGRIGKDCERPLTVEYPGGYFASLTEAQMDDYSRMLLSPVKGQPGFLVSSLGGSVTAKAPFATPWRVLVVGDKPGDLIEHNDIVRNLNPPCAIEDTSWIKPGKVIREVSLSTPGGKACIDFAVAHGLQYVEYDAGWYGHEYDDTADATTVSPDPKRVKVADLDLQEVIDYGKQLGIGILVYVNRRALERQLDEILPLYEKWGIKGVKYGFVRVGDQDATNFLHRAIRKAAEHHLIVDAHDGYRPTGFCRTYPNFLTQEGVRGNEHMPTAEHNCTLPFTRLVAGAADCTVCYYSPRIKTTHAHQLATAVVFYSPLQFLFWYDRPSAYEGEPEIEFFKNVPTVWDETKVINGQIGDFVTVARRKGDEWFVGSLTDESPRTLELPLGFLKPGQKYVAHVYSDDDTVETRTHVGVERVNVDSTMTLPAELKASGGQAIQIKPATR